MKARALPFLAALTLGALAHGAQLPEAGKKDARIRFATFDPYDVVTIYAGVGLDTHIVFDPDERILDITGGDVDAWGVATKRNRNGVFLKPAGPMPDADLHVVTDKRTYTFDLKLGTKQNGKTPFMTVYFRYPAAERAADSAAKEADQVRALLAASNPANNRRYTVQGSNVLAPIEAWDDGRTTFLRMRAHASIPAVYGPRAGEDDDAMEEIKNVSVRDDVLQIPGVHRKLMLRVERTVACVFNEAFDIDAPRPATNTASPNVKRTLKGGAK